jgi:Ca-activated chloride channel homolog
MRFASPYAFLILALLPPLVYWHLRGVKAGSVRFPSTSTAGRAGRSARQRLRLLPLALRVLALALLTVALARPQFGREEVREHTRGVAIETVVDRSGTMGLEMTFGKKSMTRLDAVKMVFKEFVRGNNKDLKGRPNDLIGMVAFARYADTLCPLTLSHGALETFLDGVQVVKRPDEDGTSIGDAIALAAARLKTAEDSLAPKAGVKPRYTIKSKLIILLTDGQNNAGSRTPLEAANLAKSWGIKIHAIGVGSKDAVATVQTPFGPYKVAVGAELDEATLKAVAETTGGIYRSAETPDALRTVYAEIDRMERSDIQATRFQDYSESFGPWALGALLALLGEAVLSHTWFRRIP